MRNFGAHPFEDIPGDMLEGMCPENGKLKVDQGDQYTTIGHLLRVDQRDNNTGGSFVVAFDPCPRPQSAIAGLIA